MRTCLQNYIPKRIVVSESHPKINDLRGIVPENYFITHEGAGRVEIESIMASAIYENVAGRRIGE